MKLFLRTPHRNFFGFITLFLTQIIFLVGFQGQLMGMQLFRIGTGGETGVYYPIGKLIAEGITGSGHDQGSPLQGVIGVAQKSAGSIENVRAIYKKEIEAGLVQADIAALAYNGRKQFINTPEANSIRAIASLYAEKFQIVVRKDSNINSFEELRGKRISIDEEGSGTLAVMRIILEGYGMTEKDLRPLYLKPVFTRNQFINKQIDGFVMMAGVPMAAMTQLKEIGFNLLPIRQSIVTKINKDHPYLFPGKIEADVYEDNPEIVTLEVYALLVVHKDMPEAQAYELTRILFDKETTDLLKVGHPQGKNVTVGTGLNGISIPLHPGADRFFRERKKD